MGSGVIGGHGRRPVQYDALDFDEAMEFKERYDYPAKMSLTAFARSMATVKYADVKTDPTVFVNAIDEGHLTLGTTELGFGRNFTVPEVHSGTNVCILGFSLAKKLFKKPNKAIDEIVNVENKKYRVVGVLADQGSSGVFDSGNMVYVSVVNARLRFPYGNTSYTINVAVDPDYDIDAATSEAEGLMRSIRKLALGEEDDFMISKSDKLSSLFIDQIFYLEIAAYFIAGITLFGAAIGLMNIMLVAVAERTREVGISKALGAKNGTILRQFLSEAILICQIGGVIGVLIGIVIGNLVSMLLSGPFIIPWLWILVGISFCFIVGIAAGIYPAVKASRLDPIESLRYE